MKNIILSLAFLTFGTLAAFAEQSASPIHATKKEYIVVVANVKVKAGTEETFKAAAREVVSPTLKEKGNITYEFNQSVADPTVFVTYERWTSQAALDSHLQTAHMQKFFGIVGELFEPGFPTIGVFKNIGKTH